MRPLTGKTALVTGAARGIGRAVACLLAKRRMRLALADQDALGLARTQREIEQVGGVAFTRVVDLTERADVDALAAELLDRWAGVDLLVNNAGVAHYGPTDTMSAGEAERLLAVNLHAPLRLTSTLLPAMLARPEAHILNVCSVLGLTAMPKVALYCASKFALVGYSDALRAEYGRRGLGVTALCPGFVATNLLDDATSREEPSIRRRPPRFLRVSPERVAVAAVAGIEKNRRRVVVDPTGRVIRSLIGAAPSVVDWMQSLGRTRRVAQKRATLAALSPDLETALRLQLGIDEKPRHRRAA